MIVEEAANVKEFADNVLKPLKVISVNTLYKDGEEAFKVVTGRGHSRVSSKDFSTATKLLYGKATEIAEE